MRISAHRNLAAPRDTVFAFLADGSNHRTLTGRNIQLLELSQPPGSPMRAVMVIRGPLGLRRRAATHAEASPAQALIAGHAHIGRRTIVDVGWELYPGDDASTRVVLGATVRSAGPVDQLLLRAGGAAWIRRLFVTTLELLAVQMEAGHARPREGLAG